MVILLVTGSAAPKYSLKFDKPHYKQYVQLCHIESSKTFMEFCFTLDDFFCDFNSFYYSS